NQIVKLLESGNTAVAIKNLKLFLAKNERNIMAHWYLGEAYYAEKKYELAIVEYKYVLKIADFSKELTEVMVRKRLARIYQEFNQLEEAQKEYILITNLEPENYEAYYQIGVLFYKRNLFDNSVAYFQKALRINPQHSETHYYLGMLYFNTGRFDEAQNALNKSLQYNSKNLKAHLYLGLIHKAFNQFDLATKEFEIAVRDPDLKIRALLENGKTYLDSGNIAKAVVELERALKSTAVEDEVKIEVRYWLSNCYERNRDLHNAIEQWEIIMQLRPSYKDVPEKLSSYSDLRTDDRLKDFLTASTQNFQAICEKMVQSMGYSIIDISPVSDENFDCIAMESEAKWRNVRRMKALFKVRRVTKPISVMPIKDLQEEMKKLSADKGVFIVTSNFAPSAAQFAATRPIDLIDKKQLTELLKKTQL
ncbi:MAG: tetratricopeptide repeat protein, partial [bacterium]|nr:tetratricopeptide repeat protein [bacterium]